MGFTVFGISLDSGLLSVVSGCASLWVVLSDAVGREAAYFAFGQSGLLVLLVSMLLLDVDFGSVPVESWNVAVPYAYPYHSITGIAASLPLGILLALGRQSRMPAIRIMSVGFIGYVRGVPLITVLFMASVMLPLFLPPHERRQTSQSVGGNWAVLGGQYGRSGPWAADVPKDSMRRR